MIEVEGRRHQPVLGPAPCQVCGAWVEWVACCGWLALASDEMHECGAYVLGAAGRPAGMRAAGVVGDVGPVGPLGVVGPPGVVATDEDRAWVAAAFAAFDQGPDDAPWLTGRLVLMALLLAVFLALALVRWQAGLL